jgi:DMSO/TMAO reductase YedYZ molybdopterin-dependent catalytic subunit
MPATTKAPSSDDGPVTATSAGPRFWLRPRVTDWSLAAAVGGALASGLVSLVSGHPDQWLIFALHGAAGLWLLLLLWGKLRRVWAGIVQPRLWDRRTPFGLAALLLVAAVLGSGIWWVAGGEFSAGGFNLLNWHIILGFAVALVVGLHMLARARRLRWRDVLGRRQLLHVGVVVATAAVLWPAQQALERALALPGARRRFTGSREAGRFSGNAFPWTSWVADQPRPLDAASWRLVIDGAVARPLTLSHGDLLTHQDTLEATLDCTGGFFTTQQWRGARIGSLLELASPHPDAQWVSFISVTSYRWTLPIAEACAALLATHSGDELLNHDHGAPARLVAPGRRGFEWVKWITRIEVRIEPDPGEVIAIHTSWLTPAGRGEA